MRRRVLAGGWPCEKHKESRSSQSLLVLQAHEQEGQSRQVEEKIKGLRKHKGRGRWARLE